MSEVLDTESDRPVVTPVEMPLPSELSTVFLCGLFMLALLAALFAAREIVLPVVLAFILQLLLAPALRLLERLRAPRMLATVLLIGLLFGAFVAAGTALSGPARTWAAKLPEGVPRLEDYLSFLRPPIAAVRQFMQQAQGYVSGDPTTASTAQDLGIGNGVWMSLYTGTSAIAGGLLETVIVLFFLLLTSNTFLRRLVEILPTFRDKRQAIEISQQIEHDISAYLVTITIMNALVGLATACVMWLCGLGDPVLWGAVAFLLNYIPFLGPMIGIVMFILAGLLAMDLRNPLISRKECFRGFLALTRGERRAVSSYGEHSATSFSTIRSPDPALQDSSYESRRSEAPTPSCILALEKMRG